MVDATIREYLEHMGYGLAYYSPPHGSWSLIEFRFGKLKYRGFSPRDMTRPDIVAYRTGGRKMLIVVLESKETIEQLMNENIAKCLKTMKSYVRRLLSMRYRHRFTDGKWADWEKQMEEIRSYKTAVSYCFAVGEKHETEGSEQNTDVLRSIIEKCGDTHAFGIAVSVDWAHLSSHMRVVLNRNADLLAEFPNGEIIEYTYAEQGATKSTPGGPNRQR